MMSTEVAIIHLKSLSAQSAALAKQLQHGSAWPAEIEEAKRSIQRACDQAMAAIGPRTEY
jgi:hydroxymethylpyrimidine/phosphomethylpyrimidine kinase